MGIVILGKTRIDGKPCPGPDKNGWFRPADWLPISHLVTDGEEKVAALYAVWDAAGIAKGYNNYCALYVTGNYTVDWGDGTIENFASGVQAEHEYVYANMPASSYCSRGYRQAIITITPQAGQHLTLLNFGKKHSLNSVTYATNNFLDVYVSGTDIGRIMMYETNNSQSKLLEKFYGYQLSNKCTSMLNMFAYCTSLQTLDLSSFNTAAVTTMQQMFYNCYSLQTIDLSSFNTAAVTTMRQMFYNCYSLQTLDLSSFNTAKVTTMYQMFYNCYSLQTLDLSSFNTAAVTTMVYMFTYCYSLQTLDLSSFNTAAVTTMAYMFQYCYSLQTIDLSSFNTAAVTTMDRMFQNCFSLQTLDLSSFNTEAVTTMAYMFTSCNSLRGINLAHTSLLNVTVNTQITNITGQLLVCRLPQIGRTFTVTNNLLDTANLNLLLTDLRDLNGSISTSTRTTGNYGTGYAVGDLIQINGGNNDARIKVLTLSGSAVATYQLMVAGTGYTVAGGLTTTAITGGGSGLKIDVTALVAAQTITITNNPGTGTCNHTIATAKNWILVK